jgi:hypothetical protein
MPRVEVLTDIPDSQVDQVVEDFESEGATATKTRQANGLWTVRATFPDRVPAVGEESTDEEDSADEENSADEEGSDEEDS